MTMSTSRRAFMRRAALLAGAGATAPLALNLAAMSSASAQSANDYRALVCIFLYGANDHHNTIIPIDAATHQSYVDIRTGISISQADWSATQLTPDNPWDDGRTPGRQMAFHPAMTGLKGVFDQGKLALAMNVGTLVTPITDYANTPPINLPPKLFSHNDQQSVWQSGLAEGATSGWGGRMADLMLDGNGTNASFTAISAAGNAVFMSGKHAVPYQISPAGPIAIKPLFGSTASAEALKAIMQRGSTQLFEDDHATIARHAISSQAVISDALADPGIDPRWFDELDKAIGEVNPLAAQLKIVAKLIAARNKLGLKRQVFFVSLGGFDHHDFLIKRHEPLLKAVSDGMTAFYAATSHMAVQDQVTTFTASDFGRTLASNGDGSDHGWGSYHMVMGGAVKGRRWYGQLPIMSLAKADDPVGGGRLVPNISVDQYGATMGRWLGLSTTQLMGTAGQNYQDGIFPNLHRFPTSDVGFMNL
jgi:uncharacterized protein (DUF1501 family)